MASYASRYESGEREQVWAELRALGPSVRESQVLPDATAVAHETMHRVAHNADLLVAGLTEQGYEFAYPKLTRDQPSARTLDEVERVESLLGPLPLALRACLLEVGGVWLAGRHPEWMPWSFESTEGRKAELYSDPLVLPTSETLLSDLLAWDASEPARPYVFEFAPDELTKANISGGTHNIELPDPSADPILLEVRRRPSIRLVEYLRTSFAWGGFPGFEFLDLPLPRPIEELRGELLAI